MYLEPCQTSEMDLFVKIVKIFQPSITFYKKLHLRCFNRENNIMKQCDI